MLCFPSPILPCVLLEVFTYVRFFRCQASHYRIAVVRASFDRCLRGEKRASGHHVERLPPGIESQGSGGGWNHKARISKCNCYLRNNSYPFHALVAQHSWDQNQKSGGRLSAEAAGPERNLERHPKIQA